MYQTLPSITLESSTIENVEQYRLCYLSQHTQVVSRILDANHHQHQASLQFLKEFYNGKAQSVKALLKWRVNKINMTHPYNVKYVVL